VMAARVVQSYRHMRRKAIFLPILPGLCTDHEYTAYNSKPWRLVAVLTTGALATLV
jgi:hypothetical protein